MHAHYVGRVALAVGLLALLGAFAGAARAAEPLSEDKRVSFMVFGGVGFAGVPGQDFEDALRMATLDDDYFPLADGTGAGESRPTPVSENGRWAYGGTLGYALSPEWEVRGIVRGEEQVDAYGVRQVLYRVQLTLDATSMRYALLVGYRPLASYVRVGAGVALTSAEVRARDDWTRFPADSDTRLGFVVEGALTWPLRARLFAEASAQYWYAGEMTYGPYDVRNGIGNIQVYFPSSKYSLDRVCAAVGLGVRI